MQTVNFQCGNCNNLMAVGAEHLGQQVRCPHCQAVVVAPTAAAEPEASSPSPFTPPAVNEQEDIFAPPEPSDDLFGQPDAPRVEMPPPAAATQPLPPPLSLDGADHPAPPAVGPVGSTLTYTAPEPSAPTGDSTLPAWMHPPEPSALSPAGPTDEATHPLAHGGALPSMVRKPRDSGGWFIGLVFIPLLSYSVLITILAGYLFYRLSQEATPTPPPSPLEKLPAFDPNDEQHSTHLKIDPKQRNRARGIDVATATASLPPNQIVPLGKKLRVGDLEIEPVAVDREVVSVMVPGFAKPEACAYPSLVLTLKLRNVSDHVVFQPMDTYFNRRWDPKGGDAPPLTILELLGKDPPTRFFGGPAEDHPPEKGGAEWVVRPEKDPDLTDRADEVLNPGEEKEFFVCTDGGKTTDDKKARDAAEAIDDHHGKLLWRVHLRRGLEVVNAHRYVPISTVIGVEFTDQDYRKSS